MGWIVALGVMDIALGGLCVYLYVDNRNYKRTNQNVMRAYTATKEGFSEYVTAVNSFKQALFDALEPEKKNVPLMDIKNKETV